MAPAGSNPYPGFTIDIADRRVRVVTGTQKQTVNICTDARRIGAYEATYELPVTSALAEADLPAVDKISSFYEWLTDRGAILRRKSRTGTVPSLSPLIPAPAEHDLWVEQAKIAAEQAISRLVNEFLEDPYIQRVEHSLHAQLYGLLSRQLILAETYEIGRSGHRTQLIHKEWPETIADDNSPRGLFDLAILAPNQLRHATLKQFRQGRIDPPIVIEVGLDYGFKHLDQDHTKLLHSKVGAPYLVHFSRITDREEDRTRRLIQNPTSPVRTSYVHHSPVGERAWKHLHATSISTGRTLKAS